MILRRGIHGGYGDLISLKMQGYAVIAFFSMGRGIGVANLKGSDGVGRSKH
jgi:hypothetical protein